MLYHLLHEADIVILGQIPVLLKVWSIVWRHSFNEMFDYLVGDERVPKVELRDIWLQKSDID